MAWDLAFNPQTKDTVPDGKGGIVLTDGAETQVQLQFDCEYAAWWGDPQAGSKLRNFKVLGDDPIAIQAEAARALGVLADRGVISNVTATAEHSSVVPGRVLLKTSSRDSRTGRTIKTGAPK